jgi:hypothetical protein
MVDFAGYLMPVQYGKEGIAASHIHTRSAIFCSAVCLITIQGKLFTKISPEVIVFFEYKMSIVTFSLNHNHKGVSKNVNASLTNAQNGCLIFNIMFSIKKYSFVTFVEMLQLSNIYCLIKHVIQSYAISI